VAGSARAYHVSGLANDYREVLITSVADASSIIACGCPVRRLALPGGGGDHHPVRRLDLHALGRGVGRAAGGGRRHGLVLAQARHGRPRVDSELPP
jgi:hypothetical protein